jgi:hypothetical protein
MSRRKIITAVAATALAASMGIAASTASAGNVAWSVSIGVPGLAVSAGGPAYGGGFRSNWHGNFGPAYAPVARPYWQPLYPGPVAFAAPVPFSAPVVYPAPVVFPVPVVYRAPVYRTRVVVAAPVWRAPHRAVPYGPY